MWRNVRDLGAFIGVAIYAVSFASLFRLVRKPDADLPPRQIAPPLHAIKEDVESRASPPSDQSPVLGNPHCCQDEPSRFLMKTALLLFFLLGFLGLVVGWAVWAWQQTAGVEMSGHGYAAMTLGIIFTLVVGCGLMALMFYSSRRGYDDRVSDLSDNDKH